MVRVGIAMTLGLVAAVVTGAARDEWHYSPAVGWIVAASVYLGATWFVVAPLNGAETEDHVAYVFEVMRYLIAGDDVAVCNLEQQRRFFRQHVQTWVPQLCDTVSKHPRARTWAAIAAFTQAFIDVETQGFDLLEA